MYECFACNKRILSHSRTLRCVLCGYKTHLNCIPGVEKDDSLYINRSINDWFCTKCMECNLPFNHLYDDEEFHKAISEYVNNVTTMPLNNLNNCDKLFTPFELNESINFPLDDIDPDTQFYSNQYNNVFQSCDYLLSEDFNTKIKKLKLNNDAFSMMHINIRSLQKNVSSLTVT